MAEFSFDTEEVKDIPQAQPVPSGTYTAQISYMQLKERDGAVYGVNAYFKILSPEEHRGKATLNFFYTASDWGRTQFKQLMLACGVKKLKFTEELEYKIINFHADLKPRKKNPSQMENLFTFFEPTADDLKKVEQYAARDVLDDVTFDLSPEEPPF